MNLGDLIAGLDPVVMLIQDEVQVAREDSVSFAKRSDGEEPQDSPGVSLERRPRHK